MGDPLALPVPAAFMWALQASAARARDMDDTLRLLLCQLALERGAAAVSGPICDQWALLASGPGRLVRWEETLTERERAALAEVEREAAETLERLRRDGKLKPPRPSP